MTNNLTGFAAIYFKPPGFIEPMLPKFRNRRVGMSRPEVTARSLAIAALSIGLLGSSALFTSPAQAQSLQAQTFRGEYWVRGRGDVYRPVQPLTPPSEVSRLRVGGLAVRPTASVRTTYDDNVDAQDDDPRDDLIVSSDAALGLQSVLRRHALGAELSAGYDRFLQDSGESDFRLGAQFDGRLDFTRHTSAQAELRYRRDRENRESAASSRNFDDVFHDIEGRVEFAQELRRVNWSVSAGAERLDFEELETADRDRTEVTLQANGRLRLTERLGLSLIPSATRLSYDRTDDLTGFDEDETRYAMLTTLDFQATERLQTVIGAGYAFEFADDASDEDNDGIILQAGAAYQIAEDLGASLEAIYDGAQDSDFDDGSDVGVTVTGRLNYAFGPRTRIQLLAERRIEVSDVVGANNEITTRFEAYLGRQIADNMTLSLAGGVSREEFDGIDREDDRLFAGATYRWAFTDEVSLEFAYRYSQRDSDVDSVDFNRNMVSVGLAARF